eukprot:1507216-Amphidinium_carterae.2
MAMDRLLFLGFAGCSSGDGSVSGALQMEARNLYCCSNATDFKHVVAFECPPRFGNCERGRPIVARAQKVQMIIDQQKF